MSARRTRRVLQLLVLLLLAIALWVVAVPPASPTGDGRTVLAWLATATAAAVVWARWRVEARV